MPDDKLKVLHQNLVKEGYNLPDEATFRKDMADETNRTKFHDNLVKEGYDLPDYDTFSSDMGFKKKVPTTSASGNGSAPTQPLNGSGDSRGRNPKISFLADIVTELNPDAPKLKEGQSIDDWGKELTTYAKQYPVQKEGQPWKREEAVARMRFKLAQKNADFESFVDERLPAVEGMSERDKNLFLYKEYLKQNDPAALKRYEETRAYKTDAPGLVAKMVLDTSPEDTERIDAEFYDKALEMSQNYLNIKYKKLDEVAKSPKFNELMQARNASIQEMAALNESFQRGTIDRSNYESNAAAIKERYDAVDAEIAPVLEGAKKLQQATEKNLQEAAVWINRFPAEAKRRMEEKAKNDFDEAMYALTPSRKMAANFTNQIGRGVTEFIANTFSLPQVFSQDAEYGWSDRLADVSQEWAKSTNDYLFPVPQKMNKGVVNKDMSVNWDLVFPKTVRTLTDMGIMASTGSPSGMVATSFVMNAKDYYDQALEQKMTPEQASKFSVAMAMQQSLLELVNPEAVLIRKGLTKMASGDAIRMLSEGVSFGDAVKATAKSMAKNVVMENVQEQAQLFSDMTGKMATNIITGSDFQFDDIGQQVKESLLLTSIVSGISGAGIGASQNSRNELEKRAIYTAVDSPELLLAATQKAVAEGQLDPVAAQRINMTVGELKQNLDALPDNVKESERSEVVNALFDKSKLVQIASNEALDPAIRKLYEDKIKEIDTAVGKIISKYVTPEKVEQVERPAEAQGLVETADVIVPAKEEVKGEEEKKKNNLELDKISESLTNADLTKFGYVKYEDAIKIYPQENFESLPKPTDEQSTEARSQIIRNQETVPPKFKEYPIGTRAVDRFGEVYVLKDVPLDQIISKDEGTQMSQTIDKYVEWMAKGSSMPPAKGVENFATEGGKVKLTDGNHRYSAAKKFGLNSIPVWVSITDTKNVARPIYAKNEISENYIKAKSEGSNPELVKAVEELLQPAQSEQNSSIEAQKADIERRRQEALNKANKQIEKTNKKEDRRLKVETYRTLDIGGNPVEVEITTNADGSRLLRARQVNEDGSIEPMAYVTERINNKSQATLTNEKLIEGYIGNEDNTLQRTNVDENPNQTHIDKINAKYDAELKALGQQPATSNQSEIEAKKSDIERRRQELEKTREINEIFDVTKPIQEDSKEIKNKIEEINSLDNNIKELDKLSASETNEDKRIELNTESQKLGEQRFNLQKQVIQSRQNVKNSLPILQATSEAKSKGQKLINKLKLAAKSDEWTISMPISKEDFNNLNDAVKRLGVRQSEVTSNEELASDIEIVEKINAKSGAELAELTTPAQSNKINPAIVETRNVGDAEIPEAPPLTPVSEVESTPTTKPNEKIFISKKGNSMEKDEEGKVIVRDKKGNELSGRDRSNVIGEFVREKIASKAGRVTDQELAENGVKEEESAQYIADNSKNARQILETIANLRPDEVKVEKERVIDEVMTGVSEASFNSASDRNLMTDAIRKNYIRKNGRGLDEIAQSASYAMYPDGDGTEISVEDVVEFIHNYPNGYKGKTIDNNKKALYDAFEQITGVRPTPAMIRALSSKKQMESDEAFAGLEPAEGEGMTSIASEPKEKKRAFTEQVNKSTDISGESKAKIKRDAIYYMSQRNDMSVGEANNIINEVGLDVAIDILKDFNNGINGGVRSVLGQLIIKQLESQGDGDKAIDVLNWLTEEATDSGQFIQAFSLWAALTPAGQVRAAQKMIKEQRESRAKKQKKQITAVKDGLKDAVKEAIDQTLVKVGVAKAGVKVGNKRSSPSYGAKNVITTREEYLKAKAMIRGRIFSNPINENLIPIAAYHLEASGRKLADFAVNLLDEFGSAIRPYIKPMYESAKQKMIEGGAKESEFESIKDVEQQIQEAQNIYWEDQGKKVVAKIDRAIRLKDEKAYKEAIAELQALPNRDELWSKYKEYAAKRLANLSMKQFQADMNAKPVLQNFTDELARTMQEKIKESLPESERAKKEPRPVIEVIADAFKNKEKYQEVWNQVQESLRGKLKEEQLSELDTYFGNILDTPFSQKQISKAVKDGLASIDKKVADIARAHYTQYDAAKRTLTSKLITEADLSPEDAAKLADAITKEFDRVMTEKKKKLLDDMFKERVINKKQQVNLETELQSLLNLGAFSDDMFVEQWAKANGYPILTAENIAEIERLSAIIQEQPDGSKKFRAIQDLLKYQGSIKGVNWKEVGMAIWYANILSSHNTQLVNAVSTALNVTSNYAISVMRDPKGAKFLAKGFYNGFTHGLLEAFEVLRTGYDPVLKGKLELPAALEIKKFVGGNYNPVNWLRFVRRVMMASDVLFFEGAKEMRAYQLARSMAKGEAKIDPSIDLQKRAIAILNKTDYDQQIINIEVELEYQKEVDKINAMSVSADIKKKLLSQAKRDRRRRAFEMSHLSRNEDIVEGAASFASRATYNYKPEGALGYMVNGINTTLHKMPILRLVIPFTNIIANVANEQINYTPIGFWRAAKGGSITGGRKTEITPLEKSELYAKAAFGTTLMTTLLIAAIVPVGDDDEPLIEITANGTGDYVKNYNLKDWMPYSFRVKGLDGKYSKWYSYQYTPWMVAMSIVGNLMDGEKYRGEQLKDESTLTKFSLAMSASMRVFLDMTFLTSLNSALDIIMNPFNPNVADTAVKSAQTTAKGFAIPNEYNQIFKQVQASFDIPNKMVRDTRLGFLLKDIPVAREMYKDQLDVLGNPVVPTTDKFTKDASDIAPIYKLIQERMYNLRVPSIKSAKVLDPTTDETTKMNEEEYYLFCKIRGEYIQDKIVDEVEHGRTSNLDKNWATSVQKDATDYAKNKIYELRESYLK